MIKKLFNLWNNIFIVKCIKSKEYVLYDSNDRLCYHWDNKEESIDIIKEYISENNIKCSKSLKDFISKL